MKIGRNAPCPCGSGKKYKQCCQAKAQHETQSPEYLRYLKVQRVLDDLTKQMVRFLDQTYEGEALSIAYGEFVSYEPRLTDALDDYMPIFGPWMMHHWIPERGEGRHYLDDESLYGRPPARVLLERMGSRLDQIAQRFLEKAMEAPFSFYEVESRQPGISFQARDLVTGESHRVHAREYSKVLQDGDILYAALVRLDDLVIVGASSPITLPPQTKMMVDAIRDGFLEENPAMSSNILHEQARQLRLLFVTISSALMFPGIYDDFDELEDEDNEEERITGYRATFEIDSPQAAFDALAHLDSDKSREELLEGAEFDEDGRLLAADLYWSDLPAEDAEDDEVTGHGIIWIEPGHLVAEVYSMQSAERFEQLVKSTLGDQARHLDTAPMQATPGALQDEDDGASPFDDDEEVVDFTPEQVQALSALVNGEIDAWLEHPLPALDQKTPQQAAQDAEGRERLWALLRETEADLASNGAENTSALFQKIRSRLGLETPF